MKRIYADLVLLSIAFIWGVTFPVIKIALASISPFMFNTVRFFIASILFVPFFLSKRFNPSTTSVGDIKTGILIGIAVFLGYTFQTAGIELTTATNAGFITSTYVVFTPLIAMFLFKARVSRREIFFVITAFAGLYLLSGFSAEFSYGDILILLCAVAFAFEIVLISHFSRIKSPIYLAFGQVLTVAILSTPLSIVAYRFELSRDVAVALLITAVFATTLARIAQNHAQKFTRSTDAAIIFSMEGVFSHILAIFMLGESLTFTEYAGAGLIVLSVIGISLSESTQKKIPQDTQKLK